MTREKAIIGESLAGLFIVETFLLQPRLFDTYIAFSPSLWWNNQALVNGAAPRLHAMRGVHARLYMSSADEEGIIAGATRLAEILRTDAPAGVWWRYNPRPEQHHNTIYSAEENPVLRAMFAPAPSAAAK